jgi:hypothetical protein
MSTPALYASVPRNTAAVKNTARPTGSKKNSSSSAKLLPERPRNVQSARSSPTSSASWPRDSSVSRPTHRLFVVSGRLVTSTCQPSHPGSRVALLSRRGCPRKNQCVPVTYMMRHRWYGTKMPSLISTDPLSAVTDGQDTDRCSDRTPGHRTSSQPLVGFEFERLAERLHPTTRSTVA